MPELNPYAVLGLPHTATAEDISRAYRRLVRQRHPDTADGGTPAAGSLHEVLAAYALLRDPARRAEYDRAHPVRRAEPERHVSPAAEPYIRHVSSAAEPYIRVGPVRRVVYVHYWYWR